MKTGDALAHEHLVVVDDEEDILELVRYNLERGGLKVTCVTAAEEGQGAS